MTDEEIKQQAEEYAEQHKMRTDFGCWWPEAYDTRQQAEAYIAGAHSRDEKIEQEHSVIEYIYYRAYSDALLWVLENAPSRKEVMKKYEYHKGMMDSTIEKGE